MSYPPLNSESTMSDAADKTKNAPKSERNHQISNLKSIFMAPVSNKPEAFDKKNLQAFSSFLFPQFLSPSPIRIVITRQQQKFMADISSFTW